jgi:hypothetical protein
VAIAGAVLAETAGARGPDDAGAPTGRCRERGCTSPGTVRCDYIDSRGSRCTTRWCSAHVQRVDTGQYCRRHAGTLLALGVRASDPRTLPPVDHRGASLVSWIFREGYAILNPAVLGSLRPGELAFEDRAVSVGRSADGGRRWERGWRIANRDGIVCRVALRVDERDDALVSLVVSDRVLARGVPPWISRRRSGDPVAAEGEDAERAQFYRFLEGFVRRGLVRRAVTAPR